MHVFCRPPPVRFMVIPKFTRKLNHTGAKSIQSGSELVTTRVSGALKRFFFDYHRQFNLDIKVVRIFNTYGPRMHPNDGRVVSNFIVQALQNNDITLYGNGEQTRSFCYVDDLIDGIIKMMQTPPGITGPMNLGNPRECTMIELAEAILKLTKSKSKLTFHALPQDDPRQTAA